MLEGDSFIKKGGESFVGEVNFCTYEKIMGGEESLSSKDEVFWGWCEVEFCGYEEE